MTPPESESPPPVGASQRCARCGLPSSEEHRLPWCDGFELLEAEPEPVVAVAPHTLHDLAEQQGLLGTRPDYAALVDALFETEEQAEAFRYYIRAVRADEPTTYATSHTGLAVAPHMVLDEGVVSLEWRVSPTREVFIELGLDGEVSVCYAQDGKTQLYEVKFEPEPVVAVAPPCTIENCDHPERVHLADGEWCSFCYQIYDSDEMARHTYTSPAVALQSVEQAFEAWARKLGKPSWKLDDEAFIAGYIEGQAIAATAVEGLQARYDELEATFTVWKDADWLDHAIEASTHPGRERKREGLRDGEPGSYPPPSSAPNPNRISCGDRRLEPPHVWCERTIGHKGDHAVERADKARTFHWSSAPNTEESE